MTADFTVLPPESDFGQEYSLLKALNKLVRDYSLGVGLFKEFIQNADDAGATEIRFILDETSQRTRVFHNPKLAQLVGPALLVWNNAPFKEQDIKNIRSLGDTEKVLKPASTGKFGLGFNTCYNVTDYPLLLSRQHIYLFDPHKTAYDYSTEAPPGKCWPLSPQLWSTSSGVLTPFQPLGLSPGQSDFAGTGFRLPLRTPDHDCRNGKIKAGPVSSEKIEELIQEFTIFAPSILLFLKHLLRIEFSIISDHDVAPSTVLVVESLNHENVTASRNIVNDALKNDIPATLQNLRSLVDDCITSCFQHSVKVTQQPKAKTYDWLVCTGLFRGPGDTLLNAAAELCERKEKAIPWAGCACPLTVRGAPSAENFQGHVFCFLPLPDALGGCRLPVHINGFFDVDTSRKGLTHEASATGSVERLRAEWNRGLINHAVAAAYELTLLHLLELEPQLDAGVFYPLWLDPNQSFPAPLDSLPTAVYSKLAKSKTLRSAAGNWQCPAELRLTAAVLRRPLVAERWSRIPDPELPPHVCDGFAKADNAIKALEPSELRSFLDTTADINCPLEASPRPALRNRDWLIALAKLALTSAPPAKVLNLPLLLLADGTLHTIGHRSSPVFLAGPDERRIFAQFPTWFIDADYAQAVSVPEVPPAHVLQMTANHVLAQLAVVLPKPADKPFTTWIPDNKEAPNEEWLTAVFQFFLDQPKTWKPDDNLFSKPCLVPDQHRQLWPAGNNLTPLLLPASLDPRLRAALETLGLQLATGVPKLLHTIETFADRFSKVWSVSPRDLADTLHESRAAWSAKLPKYNSAICDPILHFFAAKESLELLADASNGRADKLRELPIFPCQNDELVTITGHQCYVAADVTPPAVTLPTKLLRPGTWKELLLLLNIEPLKSRALIQDVLLPRYTSLAQPQQLTALAWIRDHLEEALTEAGPDQETLLSALRSAPLVFGSNNVLSRCCQLYVPNEKTICQVLGDLAVTPNENTYGKEWNRWLPFFERLHICKTPRPQDIACHIDRLTKLFATHVTALPPDPHAVTAVEQQLISVLHFIVQNWSALHEGQIALSNDQSIPFKDFLRTRDWCPPLRGDNNLRHLLIATEPPLRLFSPTQLYPPILGHLVASIHHLLPIEQRDSIPSAIRDIAPDVVRPPVAIVITHFSNLLVNLIGDDPPDAKLIKTPLQRIYSFFGDLEPMEAAELPATFAERDCIYVGTEGRFRKPKDTFRESVAFAKPWWFEAYFGPPEIEAGLTALGRKEKPDLNDLCRLTREIHASTLDNLDDEQQAQFIRILLRIEELLPDQDPLPEMRLLDRGGCPVLSTQLFFHDATWLDDKLEQSPVHLHHPQIPDKLIARLNLRRLSDHIISEPEGSWLESQNPEFLSRCETLENLLQCREFIVCLRRILSRSSIATNDLDLGWITQIRVSAVKCLQCSHYVFDDRNKLLLATSEELFFHSPPDSGDYTLTLSEAGADVLYEQVAVALQHWIGAEDLLDLSPLTKILQSAPDRIESILDKLRIRRLDDAAPPAEEDKKSEPGRSSLFDDNGQEKETDEGGSQNKETSGDGTENKESDTDGQTTGGQHQTGGTGSTDSQSERQSEHTTDSGQKAGWRRSDGHRSGAREHRAGRNSFGASRPQPKPKGRLLSYAATEAQREKAERDEDNADDELRPNKEIGDWAVHWVTQYERCQGRNPDDSNHRENKRGFDVFSSAGAPKQTRYIEVKGIDGAWDVDGVPLYPAQMDFARQHGDDFWLYVVEYAREPEKAKIHTIQNPARRITQYRFDSGWHTQATPNAFKPTMPVIGMNIQWRHNGSVRRGKIVHVGPQLLQVEVDNQLRTRIAIPNRPLQFELLF